MSHKKPQSFRAKQPAWHAGRYVKAGEVITPPEKFTTKKGEERDFLPSKTWEPIKDSEAKAEKAAEKAEASPPVTPPPAKHSGHKAT